MNQHGTMTCIDHAKHVKGHPQAIVEPLDTTQLTTVLTTVNTTLTTIATSVASISEAIRTSNLAVHVEAPIVNAQVLPAPVTVQIDKQLAPVVNVQVPEARTPDIHVDNHPPPVDLVARVNYDEKKNPPWLYVLIPSSLLACDIVVRLLHL